MSYPGTNMETFWRNDSADVKRYLNQNHGDNYFIFNVSETKYDSKIFDDKVYHCNWRDHHAPSLYFFIPLLEQMKQWLMKDPQNVLAIHCNSGKGRAGLTASALLYYLDLFNNPEDCCKYFTIRRFTDYLGVG